MQNVSLKADASRYVGSISGFIVFCVLSPENRNTANERAPVWASQQDDFVASNKRKLTPSVQGHFCSKQPWLTSFKEHLLIPLGIRTYVEYVHLSQVLSGTFTCLDLEGEASKQTLLTD